MKKFNLLVVIVWLGIFFCSVPNTADIYPEEMQYFSLPARAMAEVVYQFNNYFYNSHWSAPSEPVRVLTTRHNNGQPEYAMQEYYGNIVDGRMTRTILQNSMPALVFFMFALNIAFYAGNGTIGQWRKNSAVFISTRWQACVRWVKKEKTKPNPNVPISGFVTTE